MAFFPGVSYRFMRALSFVTESMSPTQVRLGGFIAISIALHFVMVAGAGPLDFSARRFGDAPARPDLHATLAPRDHAQVEPAPAAVDPGATETAKETAPEAAPTESPPRPGAAGAPTEEAGLALPAAEKWYTARELDVRAEPLTNVHLHYPENLRSQPVVGKVHLLLFIDERGVVRKMQIAASEPGGLFDEAARQAWEGVTFSPALKNGAPVKSQKLLELIYQPGLI
jgi:periplasmic protein TonB